MKTIEACLEKLDQILSIYPVSAPAGYVHPASKITSWDYKFISDVSTHSLRGSALSAKQASTVIKVLQKYVTLFDPADQPTVRALLTDPEYRRPLYESIEIRREVRWAGGATVLFRYPYNNSINADLRTLTNCIDFIMQPRLLSSIKTFKVIVDSSNYKHIMDLIQKHSFQFDDETLQFFMNVTNHADKPNRISVDGDQIKVEVNNDVMLSLWLESNEWLKHV